MIKRVVAALAMVLMLLSGLCGCAEEPVREYYDTPITGNYYVEYNGRVYNTYGSPCRYDATLENMGFLSYRARRVGSMEKLKGSFPAKTTFYSFDSESAFPVRATHVLLAALPGETEYYIAISLDAIEPETGYDLLHPLWLDAGCQMFFSFEDAGMTRIWSPEASEEEKAAFLEGFKNAPVLEKVPSGEPTVFWMKANSSLVVQMNLYEDGAITLATDPTKAVQLDEETNDLIHRLLVDEEREVEE